MNIIFIGQFVSFNEALSNKNYSQASNLFQNKFIKYTNPRLAISIIPIFVNEERGFNYPDFSTCFIYNRCLGQPHIFKKMKRILKDTIESLKIILSSKLNDIWFYNLNKSTFLIALYLKLFTNKRLFIIIADYEYSKTNIIKLITNTLIQNFDGAIVLNSNIKHKNRVVLPGIIEKNDIIINKCGVLTKTVLLSGSLGKTTGFEFALNYFSKKKQFNLIISGKPYEYKENEFEDLLNKYVVPNKNINYLGLLPLDQYYKLFDSVDIALSFRDPYDTQHDFNFPSKILEYLMFGKMVISTKLYPDIDSNLYFYTEINESALDRTLTKIYKLSEEEIIEKREFIYNYIMANFTEDSLINAIKKVSK